MQTIFAWVLSGLLLIAAYPWSAWLLMLNPRRDSRWLVMILTLALATGLLTLVMFWESLFGIVFSVWTITLPYLLLMLPGWWLWWHSKPHKVEKALSVNLQNMPGSQKIVLFTLALMSAAILFNAVYWPFSRDDAIGIYAFFGARMAENQGIVPLPGSNTLYEAYPIHIPLTYTFAYLASGWSNEYLARVFPALMSIGCIVAAYTLGEMLNHAGWPSALLVAIAPTFGRWASSGYVDLPMAFLFTLAAIFCWRLWHTRHWTDAVLAGFIIGLAAWTKNAALISILCLGTWLIWAYIKNRVGWREILLATTACAVVTTPWYLRNMLEAGILIPDTVWTEQARASINNLLILPRLYGAVGVTMLTGVILTTIELVRSRFSNPRPVLLLLWTVPMFLAWWIFASYDPRFLLLILPVLSVMTGIWLMRLWDRLPSWRSRLMLPGVIAILALGFYTAWNSVEFKDNLLRDPLMSNAAKHEVILTQP